MNVDPKTNLMYIADGYGNRRVLIVDAATGKYVGHFGAYGANPVVDDPGASVEGEGVGTWAADFSKGEMKPVNFRSPLHCAQAGQRRAAVCLRPRQQPRAGLQGV